MASNSSTVASGDDALYSQYNDLRKDVLEKAGEYVVAGGSANAITLTIDSQIASYVTGQVFVFKASASNTGAVTINVNGRGIKPFVYDISTAMSGGEIISGKVYIGIYDGTNIRSLGVLTSQADLNKLTDGSNIPITGHIHLDIACFAGTDILSAEANTVRQYLGSDTGTYKKVKEIKVNRVGTYTVSFQLADLSASAVVYGRVYKNGAAIGTERSTGSSSYQTYTEDFTFAIGDLVQIYYKRQTGGIVATRNFNLKYSIKIDSADGTVNLD